MLLAINENMGRKAREIKVESDFAVVGGGMSGVCAAISAARAGLSVTLVQDRPVLGGNASSEVRLWILGATSHMGNNNRWSREGGVVDEILVENMFRNKEGNPVLLDALLMDKVLAEKNIRLLLNTIVTDVSKDGDRKISSLSAFNPQNDTHYEISASIFCDASGDGVVAYRSGAAFRMGAEEKEEFGEAFSPSEQYGELLGHSMYFYTKKLDHPVKYVAPEFALKDITVIPKYENIRPDNWGCNYWWFEYGGILDTVHDTEDIRTELMKVIYGAWDYIKNSGKFPEAENMTLEWVGTIPGKRESRRFEGLYMLTQSDIVTQRHFDDAVAFGGWAIDLHPAQGLYSPLPSCTQYHSKGIYQIPYRCYLCRDIDNLYLCGRNISASHVAFGSTRVMATAGAGGQAVGMAAAICRRYGCMPSELLEDSRMKHLQQELNLMGQSIPHLPIDVSDNLASRALIQASSELKLGSMPFNGEWLRLDYGTAQMLPLKADTSYSFKTRLRTCKDTSVQVQLFTSCIKGNYTPDRLLETVEVSLHEGEQIVEMKFSATLSEDSYAFLIFRPEPDVEIGLSDFRCTGVLTVFNKFNLKVGNKGRQTPPEGSGFDSFEFWCPERRPSGKNLSLDIYPLIEDFSSANLVNGFTREGISSNAWVAASESEEACVSFAWNGPQTISRIRIYLDNDYDHAMESVQYGHPESIMPFCIRNLVIKDDKGEAIAEIRDNHNTIVDVICETPVVTTRLMIEVERPLPEVPASMFEIFIS
jgi:hypothetical protein